MKIYAPLLDTRASSANLILGLGIKRVFLIIVTFWFVGLLGFIWLIPGLPAEVVADAIVVFTGGADRVRVGGLLFQQNRGQYLLVSGVKTGVQPQVLFSSLPLNYDRITLDYESHNTLSNVLETKKWIEQHGFKHIYLVTAHYHLPRATLLLKQRLPNVDVIAYPVITQEFKRPCWWTRPKTVLKFLREYHKFLLTQFHFYSLFPS
jgi:uncharacterized SAM-binding protein YcdF (DUF218 family)